MISFCACDSGNHGSIAPCRTNAKNASPSISTLRGNPSATKAATVDFPAPGGPVTTSRLTGTLHGETPQRGHPDV